ncbi:hypothetical protein D3C76_1446650 [compost metagenome]
MYLDQPANIRRDNGAEAKGKAQVDDRDIEARALDNIDQQSTGNHLAGADRKALQCAGQQ